MFKNKKTFIFIILIFLLGGVFYINTILGTTKITENSKPSISIKSENLMYDYLSDEKNAATLYTDKLIEVSGYIKEVSYLNNKTTIFLESNNKKSSIICELNDSQKNKLLSLNKEKKITIKGICKGYLKDIILLNCFIETIKTNE